MDHITAAVPPDLLYYIKRERFNGTVRYSGLAFDIFHEICNTLNLTYDVIDADDYGTKDEGVVNLIDTGQADIGIALVIASYNRMQNVNFLTPFHPLDTCFVIGKVRESVIWEFLKPFQMFLWRVILGTMVLLSVAHIIKGWTMGQRKLVLLVEGLLTFSQLAVRQGISSHLYKSVHGRIIMCVIVIGSLVLGTLYSANLVAISAVVKENKIDTFRKLSENPHYKVMFHQTSAYLEMFMTSKDPVISRIRKRQIVDSEENLPYYGVNYANFALRIISEDLAFVTSYDESLRIGSEDCRIRVAKERWTEFVKTFPVSKTFKFTEEFNAIINHLHGSGIIERWTRIYRKTFLNRDVKNCERHDITLADVIVHFIWLGIGLSIALLVFVMELVMHCFILCRDIIF